MTLKNVVGLFGTCGDSRWREEIAQPILEQASVEYFNPVVKDWNEEARLREVDHAANDKVILLVITGETSAIGSLAESGWLALNARVRGQKLVAVLQNWFAPDDANPQDVKQNNKARDLVRKYIKALPEDSNVSVFEDIGEAATYAAKLVIESKIATQFVRNPEVLTNLEQSLKEEPQNWT